MSNLYPFFKPSRASISTKARRIEEEQQFLDQLCKIQPFSLIVYSLSYLYLNQHHIQVMHKLPHPLTSLFGQKYEKMSKGELEAVCEEMFSKGVVIVTPDEAAYLEECRYSLLCGSSTELVALSHLFF